jgi:hypothetical protein
VFNMEQLVESGLAIITIEQELRSFAAGRTD